MDGGDEWEGLHHWNVRSEVVVSQNKMERCGIKIDRRETPRISTVGQVILSCFAAGTRVRSSNEELEVDYVTEVYGR